MKFDSIPCLLLLSSLINSAAAAVAERDVLLELYDATGGRAWNEDAGWAEKSEDVCAWHGVVCSGQDTGGNVVGLLLSGNFMTGRTPTSLWTLPSLEAVDFSNNPRLDVDFSGLQQNSTSPLKSLKLRSSATTSVVGLAGASDTLEEVDLSMTILSSQLPPDLYSLTQLSSLKLAQCGILGSIPDDIQRLSVLKELNLFQNSLTGTLPVGLSRLVHLRQVSLSNNQFRGTLPTYLSDFVLLREFWAHDNDFTGPVPSFHQAPDIHKIYFNQNSLNGEIPGNFIAGTLGGVQESGPIEVNLIGNEMTGSVPASLDNLQELEVIWMLGDNQWTGVPQTICDNTKWNQGAVTQFGCYGFLCPPQTFSRHGFQTPDTACQPCASAKFFGATNCFDKDDRSVLTEIYVATRGEHWDRSDNWLKVDDVCTWYGVHCWSIGDSKTGRVRKIILPNNGMVGTIPDTIYSMHHLTTVDFSRNEIVLPFNNIGEARHIFSINVATTRTKDFDGIENATGFFHELFADQTPINGNIPTEILGMANLTVLSLQECDLSGELPDELFNLVGLHELYLSNNNLQGTLPDRWNELASLEVLALAKNQFKGPIPASLDEAINLTAVSIQDQTSKGGGLSGPVLPFATTTTIRTLMLGGNKLEGGLPEDLLTSLDGDLPITVDLSNNLVTGKVHGTYTRFKRMNIYLEGNFITQVEDQLCSQDNWMQGSVGQYGCEAILCPSGTLGGRRQYVDSTCDPCDKTGSSGTTYLGQAGCGKDNTTKLSERNTLELLYDQCGGVGWHARDSWMSGASICKWYGIDCDENGSVTSIQLGGNQLVGSFPTEIYLLPNLMHLKLYTNTLYFSFEGIENAKKLKTLGLDNTGLSSLSGVGRARSLEELNVAFNKVSNTVPEELSHLVNLRTLDISHNSFKGYIPYWLRSLISLTTFTASHNKFTGPVYDFGSLTDLIYLDLSHNKLTGSVPATLLQKAPANEKLVVDLSSNSLTGQIPAALSRLSRLSLQLQDNQISGVDTGLCQVDGWNDFAVKDFGCDAILCPSGTWNHIGRQSNSDSPCSTCRKAKYMGTTTCGGSGASRWLANMALYTCLLSWILLV